jgi:hypothetical protein
MFARLDLIAASVPFDRADVREANTTEDKIPIMAITTKSSISVKPLVNFIID